MSIGQRISQKRKELGLSQEALGDRLGVSRQSIYKWESDSALPEVEKLIALSKLFGVSVGWLLGVEGAVPEQTSGEAPGELTEQQLKMVEEIVGRYIAALPKPKPRRRWPWVIAAAVLLFAVWSLFQRLDRMDQQYNNLQNSVNNVTYSVNSQIGGISNRVEEILKAQNNLTAEYGTELTHTNLRENRAVFSVYAVPKTYVEGMTVKFSADNGAGGIQSSLGEEGFNQRFSTTLACQLTDSIALSVSFLYPDGTRQTQLLDTYECLYTNSLPCVEVNDYDLMSMYYKNGAIQLKNCYVTTQEDTYERIPGISSPKVKTIQVGLFKNRELAAWAEPCNQPDDYHGFEGHDFYRLPDMELPVKVGDIVSVAAMITDEYGRSFVRISGDYTLAEGGGTLTHASEMKLDSATSEWGFS
ncbi:helix-turn-helix domain-containing protein [Dysosmobacter sp.]|uniref:helix-turn-helix domain-containing protein n=1 Tax=Dysosmobacter sp. TaxID=2591382 RepID=UPI002A94374A|nr:helix-turn-helix domain-containing protein [Dysosmobacter sp.]MDY5612830.1 helix-turn-helix domain-containing protein [Dysosmobacter sp.]